MTHARTASTAMRQATRFWDKTADKYARTPIADEAAYQRKLEMTRQHLRPDMEVLEIGCGTGTTALIHAPFVRHVRAIDISSRMIDIARSKASDKGIQNVSFETAAIEDLEESAAKFDVVMAHSLLHLLDDWKGAVARISRLLKPGGAFVSNTACLADSMAWFKLVAPVGRLLGFIPPVAVFGQRELEQCMVGRGFEIEHRWRPDGGPAVFIIARKPGQS